jgi:hypothetical protein
VKNSNSADIIKIRLEKKLGILLSAFMLNNGINPIITSWPVITLIACVPACIKTIKIVHVKSSRTIVFVEKITSMIPP